MIKKIDIHVHTQHETITVNGQTVPSVSDFRERIFVEDNIESGFILPTSFESDMDLLEVEYLESNRLARDIAREYPDSFEWYCNIDPRMGNATPETDLSEKYLKKFKEEGAVGLGEIYANLYIDDPYMQNLYKHCEKLGLPVLFHISTGIGEGYGIAENEPGLYRLEAMLQKFPDLIFIGHSQCFWSEISGEVDPVERGGFPTTPVTEGGRVPYLLEKYPNLYADLSAMSGYNALARSPEFSIEFLNEFQDKLMYGSDYLMPRTHVKTVDLLDQSLDEGKISQHVYEKIVRLNAVKVFQLEEVKV